MNHETLARRALAGNLSDLDVRREAATTRADELRRRFEADKARAASAEQSLKNSPSFGYASFGAMLQDVVVAEAANRAVMSDRLRIAAAASGLGISDGAGLGYAVPPSFARTIWRGVFAETNLLGRVDAYPTNGETLTLPRVADSTGNVGWLSEGEQIPQSNPKAAQLVLEPREAGTLIYVTDRLLRSADAASQFVSREASRYLAAELNDVILNGDGVGKPLGIMNSGALITVTRAGASDITATDIRKMWARLVPEGAADAVWLCSKEAEDRIIDLREDGTAESRTSRLYDPTTRTLNGAPVIVLKQAKQIGTTGDLVLASLSGYAAAVSAVDQAMSMHLRFDYSESVLRVIVSIDGSPWLAEPLTPANSGDTQSHFVALS